MTARFVRRRRIALVTQYYPPEVGAPQARMAETAAAFRRRGHRVTVLAPFASHPQGRLAPRDHGRLLSDEVREGVRVQRAFVLAAPNRGAWRRTLAHLSAAAGSLLRGLAGGGGAEVFVATSPPLFTGLAGWALARLHGRPFVLDVRDLWPDAFVDLGLAREGPVVAAFRRLERFLYRAADHVVPVTEAFAARIAACGVPAARLTVVRNGVDLARFPRAWDPEVVARARAELGVADRFVVLYLGVHGVAQGLASLLPAARDAGPKTTFLFVGEGAEKPRLLAEADRLRLGERVRFLPAVPREAVPRLYAAADLCLVALRATPLMETFLPSKAFEAMGAGRGVVAAVGGEARDLLRAGPGAEVVPPEDAVALARAIARLAGAPATVAAMGREARARAEREFDRDAAAAAYLAVIETVLSRRRRRP